MDHLFYRLKSYLRKRVITDHTRLSVGNDDQGNWLITYWAYEIPQPEISQIPNLSQEEYFYEQEDAGYYNNDVYVVGTSGVIRADRRPCLSGLENNKIIVEAGRFCIDSDNDLRLSVGNQEIKHLIKAITPIRISVDTPSQETTFVIWKI